MFALFVFRLAFWLRLTFVFRLRLTFVFKLRAFALGLRLRLLVLLPFALRSLALRLFVLRAFEFLFAELRLRFASLLLSGLRFSARAVSFAFRFSGEAAAVTMGVSPSFGGRATITATVCPTLIISPARGD